MTTTPAPTDTSRKAVEQLITNLSHHLAFHGAIGVLRALLDRAEAAERLLDTPLSTDMNPLIADSKARLIQWAGALENLPNGPQCSADLLVAAERLGQADQERSTFARMAGRSYSK